MDGNNETSTFETETRENFDKILHAINEMRQDFAQRLDKIETEQTEIRREFQDFKNYVEAQFEAVRQGLVKNYNQFDRLES